MLFLDFSTNVFTRLLEISLIMINKSITKNNTTHIIIVALLSVFLVGCGSGGEAKSTSGISSPSQDSNNNDIEQPVGQVVTITSNPQSQTVNENVSVTLSVSAAGESLAYQWRKGGQPIPGATQSILVITSASESDQGVYDVVVSNSGSSETSLSALLTVQNNVIASVSLNWAIPLQREDGSDLELYEIDGYVVAYGTNAQNLDAAISVLGGVETSFVVEDLPANTYYFAIATVDSKGIQGTYSDVIELSVM